VTGADKRLRYDVWGAVTGESQDLPSGTWGFDFANVRVALAGGAALVGWAGPRGLTRAANLAVHPLTGGPGGRLTVGGELNDAWTAFPLPLADGSVALAWAEPSRLRLLTDGPADTTPLPEVRVDPPKRREVGETLVLPFRCSAPCEVRAQVLGRHALEDAQRLSSGGAGRLRLFEFDAPARPGPVRVRFTVGAFYGRRSRSWTQTYRLVRSRPSRRYDVHVVRAVRRGSKIRVTLHTDPRLPYEELFALGGFDRRGNVEPLVRGIAYSDIPRPEVTATLPGAGVRWVAVLWHDGRRKFVRVR
jgi:hypothetical protein